MKIRVEKISHFSTRIVQVTLIPQHFDLTLFIST